MRRRARTILASVGSAVRSLCERVSLPNPRAYTRRQLLRVARAACLVALLAVGADTARRAAIEGSWGDLITKDREARKVALAVAPTIVLIAVSGGDGGPAPHALVMRVDTDNSDTGDGSRWDEMGFDVTFTVNGETPTTRHSCSDPRDGVVATRYMDRDQRGGTFGHLFEDEGKAACRVMASNPSGLSTTWVTFGPVEVTERDTTGRECYVDGARADDSGNGLSWATAKKTYNAGYNVLRTLGQGAVMRVRDCQCTATPSDMRERWKIIEKDPDVVGDVTVTFTGDYKANPVHSGTDGLLIRDLSFDTTTDWEGHILGTSGVSKGVTCLRVKLIGKLNSWAQCTNGTAQRGWMFINCECTEMMWLAILFTENMTAFVEWGMEAPLGSYNEHTHRWTNATADNKFHAFYFCNIGNSEPTTGKTPIRWFARFGLWCYGCRLERTVYIGFCSGSCSGVDGQCTCFECCLFTPMVGDTTDTTLTYFSGFTENSVRNCVFNSMSILFKERADAAGVDSCSLNTIINNVFNGGIIRIEDTLINGVTGFKLYGNVFAGWSDSTAQIQVRDLNETTDWAIEGNVHERGAAADIFTNQAEGSSSVHYDWTGYTGLAFVDNELRLDTITPDLTTGECDEATVYAHTRSAGPRPFVSYNGERYDLDADIPAGAWLDAADASPRPTFTPTYQHTPIGGLFLKSEAA